VNISDVEATIKVLRTEKSFQMRPGFEALEDVGETAKLIPVEVLALRLWKMVSSEIAAVAEADAS
jgi:hypothetical protein